MGEFVDPRLEQFVLDRLLEAEPLTKALRMAQDAGFGSLSLAKWKRMEKTDPDLANRVREARMQGEESLRDRWLELVMGDAPVTEGEMVWRRTQIQALTLWLTRIAVDARKDTRKLPGGKPKVVIDDTVRKAKIQALLMSAGKRVAITMATDRLEALPEVETKPEQESDG